MNKAFLLTICLLLTSFTGCVETDDSDSETEDCKDNNEINFKPENREELKTAVDEWIENSTSAYSKYGDILCWDVSNVNDMNGMFADGTANNDLRSFNGDISGWDVSSVTNMSGMF